MAEFETLTTKAMGYEGIFKVKEVISLVKEFGKDRNYEVGEGKHVESVKKEGRNFYLQVIFEKTVNDYIKAKIVTELNFIGLTDKNVEKRNTRSEN